MRLVPALLVALLLIAPALAQVGEVPTKQVGPVAITYFATEAGANATVAELRPSEAVDFHVTLEPTDNATYRVTLTSDADAENVTLADGIGRTVQLSFIAPDEPTPAFTMSVAVAVDETNGTNVTRVGADTLSLTFAVVAPTPPPVTPGFPMWAWYLVAAAVLLVAFVLIQRARKRQVKVAPRSRTLQELQVEDKAERASPKRQAEVEAARQEVEAREAERLAQRENSILDAKRNDILRSIELMKQRHERGELTAFQFQKLKEKKEAQLAELDRQGGA